MSEKKSYTAEELSEAFAKIAKALQLICINIEKQNEGLNHTIAAIHELSKTVKRMEPVIKKDDEQKSYTIDELRDIVLSFT